MGVISSIGFKSFYGSGCTLFWGVPSEKGRGFGLSCSPELWERDKDDYGTLSRCSEESQQGSAHLFSWKWEIFQKEGVVSFGMPLRGGVSEVEESITGICQQGSHW